VTLEYPYALDGHSDADVLIHAVCDALLGAANLRDIGFHFPTTDPRFKNIDSVELLRHVAQLLGQHHWRVGNVDATVVAEAPKLNPHIPQMQVVMAQAMGVGPGDVSVKATTNEGMGFVGRQEGIAAHAVALILSANGPA